MKKIIILLVALFLLSSCQKDEQQITYVVDIYGAEYYTVQLLVNNDTIEYHAGGSFEIDYKFNCIQSEPLRLLVLTEQSDSCHVEIIINGATHDQYSYGYGNSNTLITR